MAACCQRTALATCHKAHLYVDKERTHDSCARTELHPSRVKLSNSYGLVVGHIEVNLMLRGSRFFFMRRLLTPMGCFLVQLED